MAVHLLSIQNMNHAVSSCNKGDKVGFYSVKARLFIFCTMGTSILLFVSSESGNASWEIAQVTLKDEGYYECIAISSAGTGRARTFLDVSGKHM